MNKLNYFRNKVITGEKVFLKKIKKSDLKKCILWLADPEVNKYLSANIKNVTGEQELEWYEFIKNSETDLVFTINTINGKLYIGNCGLHKIDTGRKSCEFGIFIGDSSYWNKGYGTDAIKTTINFALNVIGLETVCLIVYEYNNRAINAYEKCGFARTGLLKKHHFYNDIYWDAYAMEYAKK